MKNNSSFYRLCAVVVVEGLTSDPSTYDQAGPYMLGATSYITAAWNEEDVYTGRVPAEIVIGDDIFYVILLKNTAVGYRNVPLKSGTLYSFFTRYDVQNKNQVRVYYIL